MELVIEWDGLPLRRRVVAADGATLAVAVAGDGPPLLLLHGIGSSGASWMPVAADLAAEFTLYVVDQRGHGASGRPTRGYLLADYAADLAGVITALGLKRPLVMGHSLGGMVTLTWARQHPDMTTALVVEDVPLRHGGPGVEALFDGWIALASMSPEEAASFYAEKYPHWTPEERERRAETITSVALGVFTEMKAAMLPHQGESQVQSFAGITAPALLIHGDLESGGMVPASDARAFAATLPNGEAVRIPGGSHSLHRDSREAFLAAVLPFLRAHAGAAR